jgi:hypothetical protein
MMHPAQTNEDLGTANVRITITSMLQEMLANKACLEQL